MLVVAPKKLGVKFKDSYDSTSLLCDASQNNPKAFLSSEALGVTVDLDYCEASTVTPFSFLKVFYSIVSFKYTKLKFSIGRKSCFLSFIQIDLASFRVGVIDNLERNARAMSML